MAKDGQSCVHQHRSQEINQARRLAAAIVAVVLALGTTLASALPASAYALSGCKWSTGVLRIDYRYVNGPYRDALINARHHYNSVTDVSLSTTDSAGPSWTAANANYGATGWNGQAQNGCLLGRINSSTMRLNQYYIANNAPARRIQLVWLHEMGHSLGLNHVNNARVVMYGGGTSTVYSNGITTLQADDRGGINKLY